ncbi:ClpP family protease [Alienimonas californiensis]|uniref:ATP-dependent Clp protease proteolytic subunit n=1 Tax=Alienimonas californiensis TaxID=2527989 RepID=A0A517P4Z0_9PLAN|nr:ATP-dependent Clp protease proteolytic subunit [Alienimonas californiensis]QDT14434.1 ATP-dependent Clp protease proteolytic subunit [Alienimonas californiensis]
MPRRPLRARQPLTSGSPRRAKPEEEERPPQRLFPAPGPGVSFDRPPRKGDWELALSGDLTDRQAEIMDQLIELPRGSAGTLWFDSPGGSVYTGLAMASVLRLRGLRATAVVAGECSSAAILPFAACERRLVTRHATLLFHPVRWHSEEDVKREEAVEWARHFDYMERDIDDLLSKLLPMERESLEKWTRPGKFVTGAELVEVGLAEAVDLFAGDLWAQTGPPPRAKRTR